ncbi:DUF5011 domain-containing protein [Lactococcus lactis]|uniref:immunoglobulin-like domain-containing protein n=1 Tax=Lactococcus lactis TaxID=1358 RepID=UPI00288E69E0|nr:immunoglobulin-like domain-containing protein [Lactococcus lactis]MDT2886125.1 DUF5011 domain-containing protein [Lactococcus lactis]MDT2899513.1 DUF5011 domain-containing protein [Lactococcus lactis]MDT2928463.1 DUF5011 domain-containing protein [Lactococcus lactis]
MKKQGFRTWKRGKTWVSALGITLIIGNSSVPIIVNADTPNIQASILQNNDVEDDGSQIIFVSGENLQLKKGDLFTPIDQIVQLKNSDGSVNDKSSLKVTLDNKEVNLTEKLLLAVGTYIVSYSFTDKDGSTIHRSLTVTVSSQSSLNLKSKEVFLKIGETFEGKKQVESLINSDGSVNDGSTLKIDDSQLDTSNIGNYKVVYSFIDDNGQTISQTLMVKVESGSVINLTTHHVTLTCGDYFEPRNYIESAFDSDGKTPIDLNQITVDSKVNPHQTGTYEVIYSFTDNLGNLISSKLLVDVQDKSSLTLTTNEISVTYGDVFNPQIYFSQALKSDGKTPVDFSQISVNSTVNTAKAGDYQVIYSFVDSSGKTQSQTLMVHVLDQSSLTLISDVVKIHAGNEFNPFDYVISALDSDGKTTVLDSNFTINSNVNMQQAGDYQVIYSFVNNSGNTISKTLRVNVYGEVVPPIVPPVVPTPPVTPIAPPKNNSTAPITPIIPVIPPKNNSVESVIPPKPVVPPTSAGTVATLPSFVDSNNKKGTSTTDFETPSSFLQSGKKDKKSEKTDKDKSNSQPKKKSKTLKQAMIEADSQNKKNHKKNNVIQTIIKIFALLIFVSGLITFVIIRHKNKVNDQE